MRSKEKIFISHASLDENIIKTFIDDILIGAMEFSSSEIFCTSVDGMKIESGEEWRNSIKDHNKQGYSRRYMVALKRLWETAKLLLKSLRIAMEYLYFLKVRKNLTAH